MLVQVGRVCSMCAGVFVTSERSQRYSVVHIVSCRAMQRTAFVLPLLCHHLCLPGMPQVPYAVLLVCRTVLLLHSVCCCDMHLCPMQVLAHEINQGYRYTVVPCETFNGVKVRPTGFQNGCDLWMQMFRSQPVGFIYEC